MEGPNGVFHVPFAEYFQLCTDCVRRNESHLLVSGVVLTPQHALDFIEQQHVQLLVQKQLQHHQPAVYQSHGANPSAVVN